MTPVGSTSQWVAAMRAMESESANPLIHDPYARALAGSAGFDMLASITTGATSSNAYLPIRTRYLDDRLREAVDDGLRQIVILAAGMDSRAFRLQWPVDTVLFEVDREEIFDHKEPILSAMLAHAQCDRRVVRADMEHDWVTPLARAGFNPLIPSVVLVEGLLVYLTENTVDRLMSTIAGIAPAGSVLMGDMPGVELLTSPWMTPYLSKVAEYGCPWVFGVTDPDEFLSKYGWSPKVAVLGGPDANFGRWPFPPPPAQRVPGIPRSYLFSASR